MEYERILEDMSIAKKAITDSLLDVAISQKSLLCELYCVTSFSDQSFYVQVYDGDQYVLLFAKPILHTPLGISSVSVPFSTIIEAEKHLAFRGDIYCGLKRISSENATINTLIRCLPTTSEFTSKSCIAIDGITTVLINHCLPEPAVLYYRNEESFNLNSYTIEDADFLHKLYAYVQEIIGNLIRDTR